MADATEEQVTQTQAANEAEMARWKDDFSEEELTIPYKREETDGKRTDEETEEEFKTDETADDGATEIQDDLPAKPVSVVTTEDPGEYKPADYSFEVTLASGKTAKVTTPEEAEKIADDPDNFETPKQLMEFINKQNKMQRNLDRDYDKWESQKKDHDFQVGQQREREIIVDNLAKGFEYLESKGLIPAIDPKYKLPGVDWGVPDIAKQAGVKEQIALINYMTKENESRIKAGIPPLSSALDAYNAWKLDTNQKDTEKEQKEAGEARKRASSRVAGVSSSQQGSYVPKGIAVGRVLSRRGAAVWDD